MTSEASFTETWSKRCGCGASYDEGTWEALAYVGLQRSGLDGFPDLELRMCSSCGSTLAIVVACDFVNEL